jgi:hypothetical protein
MEKGPSALCAELRAFAKDVNLDVSTVHRWRSGDIRPEAFWRAVMFRVWGIPEADWLTPEEQVVLGGKGAA